MQRSKEFIPSRVDLDGPPDHKDTKTPDLQGHLTYKDTWQCCDQNYNIVWLVAQRLELLFLMSWHNRITWGAWRKHRILCLLNLWTKSTGIWFLIGPTWSSWFGALLLRVVHGPAAAVSPGSLSGVKNLTPPRHSDSKHPLSSTQFSLKNTGLRHPSSAVHSPREEKK